LREYDNPSSFNNFKVLELGSASDPDPADGTVDVEINSTLSWSTGEDLDNPGNPNPDITKHYLYIQADDPNLVNVTPVEIAVGTNSYNPTLVRDATYYWRVDESVNNSSPGEAAMIIGPSWDFQTVLSYPIIDTEPEDLAFAPGDDAVYVVEATNPFTGDPCGLSYQWFKVPDTTLSDGADYDGVTTNSLTVFDAQAIDEGEYFCRVTVLSNSHSRDSQAAMLTIERLLAHWTMDKSDYTGGQYVDIVGGHNATSGGPDITYVTGMDGTANGAVVADPNSWAKTDIWSPSERTGQISISLWANWAGDDSEPQRPIAKRLLGWDTTAWHIDVETYGTPEVHFYSYADGSGPHGSLLADEQWQHVCVTFENNTAIMYINGKQTESAGFTLGPLAGTPVVLCAGKADGSFPFNGALDDFRIYNYSLSAEEVAELWYSVTGEAVCINPPDAFDYDEDCDVDLADFAIFAGHWLESGLYPN